MKKYLLSFFAIAMAIGFSAFTVNSENKPSNFSKPVDLYWYLFDGTNITTQVGTSAMSKASAKTTSSCNDNPVADICAYGYTNAQTGLPKLPGSSNDSFRKTN
jgi:hypothetical protein